MKTHPHILVGGVFIQNPYYIPPDELLSSDRGRGTFN